MKKIYLFSVLAVAIFAVVALSSCNPLVKPNNGGTTPSATISTTIQNVRINKATFVGTAVTVEGTVICAPGEISLWQAYIQNGDYGILISGDANDSSFSSLKRKTKIKVTGVVDIPKAKYLRIGKNPVKVTKIGTATNLPDPKVVTINDLNTNDNLQGTLIELQNVKLEDPSKWPAEGKSASVVIEDTTGATTTMRIDSDTDIDGSTAPSGTFNLVGVAAYYYSPQILPRDLNDIK